MPKQIMALAVLLLPVSCVTFGPTHVIVDNDKPWSPPPLTRSVSVQDGTTGEIIPFERFLDRLAKVDAVFVGETHTDETTHRVELAVYDGLLRRRAGKVVLAMEMFERDVQAQLDAYISGEIDEAMFLAHARPWSNYRAAYRPMIELARAHRRPVVASNFPRPLLRQIAMGGEDSYGDAVAEAGHRQLPTKLFPNTDAYWRRVDNAIRSHRAMIAARGGMGNRLLSTQCLWDNAMGEACAYALDDHPGHTVVHVNGAFHSAYWDGTVRQFQLRKPDAKVATVAVVSVGNPGVADVGGAPVADYVVFAEARATDVNEGKWSVYVDRELEYVLSLPEHPFDKEALPLLIWLSDDGWTTDEGLALWQKRLGNEAAIAVLKAPYPQTGADLGGGGRWFWPDTFPADVSTMIVACERAWAYILRHYPIDPARVCLAGEGTGATVASSIALLTDRMDLRAIAMSPRQYAKIKDFPLPLPEFQGDAEPPTRTLHVWGSEEDQAWWSDELAEYGEVGMDSEMVLATTDPWQMQREAENMVRAALGLKQTRTPKAAAYYHILVNDDSRRARRWARLAALKFEADGGACVAVVDHEPEGVASTAIPATVRAESFASEDALPECPGPFGGTTVVVVPEGGEERALEHWVTVEEDDPLAKQSRFHRLRVATMDANHERGLPHVLSDLLEARRKNVLIVPALYCADAGMMQRLQRMVREFEDRMTIQWMPGLGGRDAALSIDTDGAAQGHVFHTLSVEVDPATHTLAVDALIDLPKAWTSAGTEFVLNEALYVVSSKPAVTELGPDGEGDVRYALAEDATDGTLQMTYNGKINYELSDEKEQYTRGFRQTRGLISDEGIYLSLGTTWVPYFDARMIRFSLDVTLPSGWHIISQGDGTSRDDAGHARWHSSSLVEQVFMVGGPLVRISESTGTVESLVFLHEPDDALARRYLDATAMYIEMYRQLIGPYPYSKFALVENFWETGYGMPSFTVLGPTVIRLPFIVHSSYPHEILHNWWGNSVFVDYEHGNWCEGLTAYMADHLMKEQRGKGHEYRRNTLQKYRDYVNEGRDFPLVEFTSRHNAATEAVGYGKSLMMYHMLRRQLGDEAFKEATAELYRKHRGDRVTFADLEAVFEATSGDDLSRFFDQWVNRAGAPQLAVKDVIFGADSNSIHVTGVLEQTQSGAPYTLQVPLMVVTDNGPNWCRVDMTDRRQTFTCEVALTEGSQAMPVMLAVDPMFDVFRTLDPRETPPSIGQLFGEPEILAVLPGASPDETDLYRSLMASWASDEHHIETVFDSEINALPHDRAVWVLGKTNRFVSSVLESPLGDALTLGDEEVAVSGHTFVVVARHPENIEKAVGWICVEPPAAADGLIRKLPHYGKYSYLAFEGDEPTNIAKGQQSTDGSPMVVDLRGDTTTPLPPVPVEDREPLADLPAVFSQKALTDHVNWLAAPDRQGRGLGSSGLEQSAAYIAKHMEAAGLTPGGDDGTWFQRFTVAQGSDGTPVKTMNVVGILPGTNEDWADQSIVLGAHYDHLGLGWPDVHAGDEGKIHVGADDNASGVSVMLELARNLADSGGGSRTLVCVAFSAEECGLHGSKFYIEHPARPAGGIQAMINLDTVGRLFDNKLAIHGTGTATEWPHIFRGCGFVTGIDSKNVKEFADGSDQKAFVAAGIPAVQVFTGAHADYHRPTDTPDKIDGPGLVKVATFVKEALVYLLEREEPLTATIGDSPAPAMASPHGTSGGRKVLFGTVPDFGFAGPGVKVDSIVPESPAAKGGLQAGDVLLRMDDEAITDLPGFSAYLKTLSPGDKVTVTLTRDDQEMTLPVTVRAR